MVIASLLPPSRLPIPALPQVLWSTWAWAWAWADRLQRLRFQQDYFYLVDYVKYKAIRLARCPLDASANDLSALEQGAKSVLRQVHSAKEFREVVLQGDLQLSGGVIDGSARCEEERRYAEWLQDGGEGGWYGMYVKSIPCIYVSLSEEGGGGVGFG